MIKIGVIGAGNMGRNHIRNLHALSHYYDIAGFHDISQENIDFIKSKYGIVHFGSVNELLDNVNAVIIATPSNLHYELALRCVNANKHTLVEKPLTLDEDEAKILCKEYRAKNKVLMVGHVERYSPVIQETKKILDCGEDIIAIEARRCGPYNPRISDTNVIYDLMIHDIDIVLNYLYNVPVASIISKAVHVRSNNLSDYVYALMQHETGAITSLLASRVTEDKIRTIDIHTRLSLIKADLLNRTLSVVRKTNFKLDVGYTPTYKQENVIEKVILANYEPLKEELVEFAMAINEGREPLTNGESATKALHYAQAIDDLSFQGFSLKYQPGI